MRRKTILSNSLVGLFFAGLMLAPSAPLLGVQDTVIHEWGTFTSLLDEEGNALGGINTDDEPVPAFVHRLARFLLLSPSEVPPAFFQGAPRCHPDVTMRLETPVIYFHPPKGHAVRSLDVQVAFHGGWLSEYFPQAIADAPGLSENDFKFGPLSGDTTSKLTWKQLKIGVPGEGPVTTEHVWTSPRAVEAATVQSADGEKEKFLFYRGVAHLDSPLRVSRDETGKKLEFRSQLKASHAPLLSVNNAWLVEILRNGNVAFRPLPDMILKSGEEGLLATTLADFAPSDFTPQNLTRLKTTLRSSLVRGGLNRDEADALLNTWELSYFKSAGLRVFYLVPQSWTDAVLPLKITDHPKVTRLMVGRIELVTPEQRRLLNQLSQQESETIETELKKIHSAIYDLAINTQTQQTSTKSRDDFDKLFQGQQTLAAGKVKVPRTYQMYLDLGRFRNALVLEEQKRRPSKALAKFIELYRLEAYNLLGVVRD